MHRRFFIALMTLIILFISCILLYKYRSFIHSKITHYHLYHELKYIFFAQKYAKGNVNMKYYYDKEAWGKSVDSNLPVEWWFRPSHLGVFCSTGLVDDVDNDGKPEVYVCGGSKYIYCLDGKTGKLSWKFTLPFAHVGALAAILEDVNNDGMKELIVGSHTDLPLRVY